MTSGNQRISMSGVFGPALLARTGTSLEDFELYGSLYERAPSYYIHQRDDRHLLIVVDTDKCGTRRSEIGHWPLSEGKPLQHRKNCLDGRIEEIERVTRFGAQTDRTG